MQSIGNAIDFIPRNEGIIVSVNHCVHKTSPRGADVNDQLSHHFSTS